MFFKKVEISAFQKTKMFLLMKLPREIAYDSIRKCSFNTHLPPHHLSGMSAPAAKIVRPNKSLPQPHYITVSTLLFDVCCIAGFLNRYFAASLLNIMAVNGVRPDFSRVTCNLNRKGPIKNKKITRISENVLWTQQNKWQNGI